MVYQERFLGSSIRNYSASIGWNEQPSEIKIGLVDDPTAGDEFLGYPFYNGPNQYVPGDHAFFWHQNTFNFGGIIQSMTRTKGAEGNPLYEVTMRDPRFILDGVQLITNDYTGTVLNFQNIFNVFGFYESQLTGLSYATDSGMPWTKVVDALTSMLNMASSPFGTHIAYRDQAYGVYMTSLPNLPFDYYVGGGGNMTLMEFIQEICDAGGCDWFCNLEYNPNYANPLIMIYLVRRDAFLTSGAIETFTENVNGCVSNSAGIELVDSTCHKLLIGGNKEDVWFGTNIRPYWGIDSNGNIIFGNGTGDNHQVNLDATTWSVYGIGNTYATDVAELRASLDSQESWEAFLWFRNNSSYIQAGYASNLGILGDVNKDIVNILNNTPANQLTTLQFSNLKAISIDKATDIDGHKNRKNLYDTIRGYATEYMGKKFVVSIPSVYYTSNTGEIKPSREIVESAYLDESSLAAMSYNNLIPFDTASFTTEEGKYVAYVRFDGVSQYDFSEINDDDKFLQGTSVFVKCQVDSSPVFENSATGYGPRAVVTLPGVVRYASNQGNKDNVGVLVDFLLDQGLNASVAESLYGGVGGDFIVYGREAMPAEPSIAAVPMRSNIECYGPWWSDANYANGVPQIGKAEFEKDETLVPWNYGGYTNMNLAGLARVIGVLSNQPWSETGHVEFPGIPQQNLGGALIAGGPYVSDIACSVGEDGAKTTYRLNRYTPNFGRLTRYNVDKIAKLGKAWQQQKRASRTSLLSHNKVAAIVQNKQNFFKGTKAKRDKSNSSHHLLLAQKHGFKSEVVTQAAYNTMMQLGVDYDKKAGVSIDGLFRPFSTGENSNMSHIEEPDEDSQDKPNSTNLNPYQDGHDIQCVVHGDSVPDDLVLANLDSYPSDSSYRPLALRGPMMITGWGYDTKGKPVPNQEPDDPGDEFLDGWLQKSDEWKTGPLDTRWDNKRKVWVAGGANEIKVVKVLSDGIEPPTVSPYITDYRKVYKCLICELEFEEEAGTSVTVVVTDEEIYAANFRSLVVLTDKYYLAYKIDDKYVLDVQADFTDQQ